jgi:chemotaxis protein methyltransferase CheR
MLVDELMLHREGWNISILGTDINEESLTKARRGLYGAWAFRGLDPSIQNRYFEKTAQGYQISEKLRGMVRFAHCNLRSNDFPSPALGIHDFDLILCRNVLIYFGSEAIVHTLKRFALSLREGGYLLTGHAELANQSPAPLHARTFAESVAYQRCDAQSAPPKPNNTIAVTVANFAPIEKKVSAPLLPPKRAPLLPVMPISVPLPPFPSPAPPAKAPVAGEEEKLCQQARQNANLGRYDEAIRLCREAIALDATGADAYFVWGQVEGEQGQQSAAKDLFKKVVYLSPQHFDAHLELAAIYDQENDAPRARREREAALRLLSALDPDELLASHPGARAAELVAHLQSQLSPPAAKGGR